MKALTAQLRWELTQTLRNGEQLLLVLVIPVIALIFFAKTSVINYNVDDRIDFVAPGALALATMATAMTSLGISTGFDRHYGVLKRLGTTPLGRGRMIAAKLAAAGVVIAGQIIVLGAVAYALGWRPTISAGLPLAVAAGAGAFGGIGLAFAGTLRGEVNLAASNGVFLILMLLGDMIVPLDSLGTPLEAIGSVLPAAPLAQQIRDLTGSTPAPPVSVIVLGIWAVLSPLVAARVFRWD